MQLRQVDEDFEIYNESIPLNFTLSFEEIVVSPSGIPEIRKFYQKMQKCFPAHDHDFCFKRLVLKKVYLTILISVHLDTEVARTSFTAHYKP